ncbi:MAG: hypothetical protein RIM99_12180 [Cyclobacteriaceae bacterium]
MSKSGYYHWLDRRPSKRQLEYQKLKEEVQMIYHSSNKRYGTPKITIELAEQGWRVSSLSP